MNAKIRLIIILFVFFLIFPSATSGSDFRAGERLVITRGQTVNDDIYFAGSSIIVDGVINGDLTVASGDITVNGIVNGGVMAAGGLIIINGNVTDDIRAAGGNIKIGGNVGDNALVFAGNLILEKDARIGRDLTVQADSAVIDGTVNGNINGGASNMEMSGTSMGNVTMNIENNMKILPGAKIGGNLEYTGPKPAEISGTVSGRTIYKEKTKEERRYVSGITGEVIGYLWLLLIGILFLILAPVMFQRISDNVSINPLKNFLWGILFLIVTPILAIILLITIIGIPLGFILLVIYIIEIYLSRIFVGFWIGQYILKRLKKETRSKILPLAVGLLLVLIGINLPILGLFIHVIIIIFGLGAIILTKYGMYQKLKQQTLI